MHRVANRTWKGCYAMMEKFRLTIKHISNSYFMG